MPEISLIDQIEEIQLLIRERDEAGHSTAKLRAVLGSLHSLATAQPLINEAQARIAGMTLLIDSLRSDTEAALDAVEDAKAADGTA